MTPIEILAQQVGFHSSYTNSFGDHINASDDSRKALLAAMGFAVETEHQLMSSIDSLQNRSWLRLLPATKIVHAEDNEYRIQISLCAALANNILNWEINCELGDKFAGSSEINSLPVQSSKSINNIDYQRVELALPRIPEGYHTLVAWLDGDENPQSCNLIVAPASCYGPSDAADYKMWGFAAQLYSLKSENSWGIGDFSDLNNLVMDTAERGGAVIGLNPLHPLFPGNTQHRSPYSPTSRSFLNTLYIDVTKVPDYKNCKKAVELVRSKAFRKRIKKTNNARLINYPEAASLKYEALELLYEHFLVQHQDKETVFDTEFKQFCDEFGNELDVLATFDALYEYFRKKDINAFGWTSWPDQYQNPDSAEVKQFQQKHKARIGYFKFIQWVADKQLAEVAAHARKAGMPIGLYLDLAVGTDGSGADVWANRSVYVSGGSVGAPPDALNLLGQDWGLTPMNPLALIEQGFQPLVKALRSCMRHAGALRIDHVLGYMRQYWVAPGKKADDGIYISFPFEDMLRIIALESRRANCVVIGEDLGTTPDGFGQIMAAAGLLSYRVLFFERWENGLFKRPESYPEQAMVTVSTHDLPTFAGWWSGTDCKWRSRLNLYPADGDAREDVKSRKQDKKCLFAALEDMNLINSKSVSSSKATKINNKLAIAVQQFLAMTPGRIQLIPLEDALRIKQQVNIPGTINEHPNWLQRLPFDLDEIWQRKLMKELVRVMHT